MQRCISMETMRMHGLSCVKMQLLVHASVITERKKCRDLLDESFTSFKFRATTLSNTQQGAKSAYILNRHTATRNLLVQQMSGKFSLVYLFVSSFMMNHSHKT